MPAQTRSNYTARGLTVAAAIGVSLLVWLIAVPLAGVDLVARTGQGIRDVGAAEVVVTSALAGLAGWVLLELLERRAANPIRVWTVVALVVLVLSLLGPLGASTAGGAITLVALHLATAAALIVGFRRFTTARHAATKW